MEICKAMIVIKTSIFPASKEEVFNKLQKLKLKLFGIIPFGTHKINVVSFDKDDGIYTYGLGVFMRTDRESGSGS